MKPLNPPILSSSQIWNNHSEQDATWEREDYLREVYPAFYEKGRSFKSRDEISIRGRGYNTLVLSMHWALAFHEHNLNPSIHEDEHKKFHLIHFIFITCDVAFIYIYMLAIGCDQCMK